MKIDVLTLFPEFFRSPLKTGLVGRAVERGDVEVKLIDPRDFTTDKHRTVDDQPFGGGGGMVLKVEPVAAALESVAPDGPVVLLTPQGRPLRQQDLQAWSKAEHLTLVAGRYEGFDDRIRSLVTDEISIGDYVVTGGEYAALVLVDGVVRLLPGTLGNQDSPELDSFSPGLTGLLEYPHYTRPASWRGLEVPSVLRSGDHARVAQWRREQSLLRTAARRPELLRGLKLEPAEAAALRGRPRRSVRLLCGVPPPLALDLLVSLAGAYRLEVDLVHPDPAIRSTWESRVAAVDPWLAASPAKRTRRSTKPAPAALAADLVRVRSGADAPPGAAIGLAGLGGPTGPVLGYAELADLDPLVIDLGGGSPTERIGYLPPVRDGAPWTPLPAGLEVVIQLERLLGDA